MKPLRIINCPMMGGDFLLSSVIFIASILLPSFDLVEDKKVSFIVGLLTAICLLIFVADRRVFEIDEEGIVRHAFWSRQNKIEKRNWADVNKIVVLDDRGATSPSLLFEFKHGKAMELPIKNDGHRRDIVEHARRLGVIVQEKLI